MSESERDEMAVLLLPPKLCSCFPAQRPHPLNFPAPSSRNHSPCLCPDSSISKFHPLSLFLPYPNNQHHQNRVIWRRRGRRVAFEEDVEDDGDAEKSISCKFEEAVTLFNNRKYYECHDFLESIWYSSNDPIRTLIHAILQSAVAFHHLSNQNHKGAMMELGEGLCKLRKLNFKQGPFHRFEQEISAVLEFIYQTQLELAACNDEFCIAMEQSERSYQLLGGFAAGEHLYSFEDDGNQVIYIVFRPQRSYGTPNPPSRVKLPTLCATGEHLMVCDEPF